MLTLYDEADFARTFLEVILPVQAETGSKLIGMSSPSAGGGSFTRVVFATDADGKKLMNSMILGAPCPLCRAGPHPEECEHNLEEIASWKDPKKMEKIKKVLIAVHAESIYRTELCAMANEGTSTLFARYLYEKLLSAPPTAVGAAAAGARASLVFGAVDPAGGGKSEFALTAIAQVPALKEYQGLVFCSEKLSAKVEEDQIFEIVELFVKSLRSHPRVGRGVPIVVAIEACSPGDRIFFPRYFLDIGDPDLLVMSEIGGGRGYGVPKTERETREMVTTMQAMLSPKFNLVTIPPDAMALSTKYVDPASRKGMGDIKEMLAIQFSSFRLDPKSGKMSGKAGGGNDDLLITFMMALYWMMRFSASDRPEYVDFRRCYSDEIWEMAQPAAMIADSSSETAEIRRLEKKRMRLNRLP